MIPFRWTMVLLTTSLLCGCNGTPPQEATSPPTQNVAAAENPGLYCKEHGVPEKFCTLCHEELKGKLLACTEHGGLPEDICTQCHPEVEKKYNIEMCPNGHKLPKHFCAECKTKA